MQIASLVISILTLVVTTVLLFLLLRRQRAFEDKLQRTLFDALNELSRDLPHTVQTSAATIGKLILDQQRAASAQAEERFRTFETGNEKQLEAIRMTIERRLVSLQTDNNRRLEEMRQVVDEKLQKTLESKMTESFRLVSERLEQVYRGLGEMQTLAVGVGDLKKVLSNVKTRGILGEIRLGAILEEILSPEQYAHEIATKRGSRDHVEYAVKLPTDDGAPLYLPIDAKFPGELYAALQDAYDSGSPEAVLSAAKALLSEIRCEAKDIRDKYLDPPFTTDFAILFLPFEGLYAEAVNRGLIEELQRVYRVNIAGPSTMAALLNSLQMGFRTFAIQKRSGEVWRVLGAVKTEFSRFETILKSSRARLQKVDEELEQLVGARTRAINRQLSAVEQLDERSADHILGSCGSADDPVPAVNTDETFPAKDADDGEGDAP